MIELHEQFVDQAESQPVEQPTEGQAVDHEDQPKDQDDKKKRLLLKSLDTLIKLRYSWKNGDPGEIKRSHSPDNKWKVRKGWFTIVGMRLEFLHMLASMGVINFADELRERIQYFLKIIQSYGFSQRLTAESEVDWADQTIDEVVSILRGQFEKEFAEMLTIRKLAEETRAKNHIPDESVISNPEALAT